MHDPSALLDSELEMIKCSRQPGGLRITKGAFARQYNLVHKKTGRTRAGPFGNSKLWRLEVCSSCPKGQLYAQRMSIRRK